MYDAYSKSYAGVSFIFSTVSTSEEIEGLSMLYIWQICWPMRGDLELDVQPAFSALINRHGSSQGGMRSNSGLDTCWLQ